MKIRNGFISNSSTTSFCIVGCMFEDKKEIKKLFKKELVDKYKDSYFSDNDFLELFYEEEEKAGEKIELSCHVSPSDETYVGVSIKNLKDNQTLIEFKELVKQKLSKYFNRVPKVDIIVEGWGDY